MVFGGALDKVRNGHQLAKLSVKLGKVWSMDASTVMVPVSGGMVGGWSVVLPVELGQGAGLVGDRAQHQGRDRRVHAGVSCRQGVAGARRRLGRSWPG
jgi:hypothetical protein